MTGAVSQPEPTPGPVDCTTGHKETSRGATVDSTSQTEAYPTLEEPRLCSCVGSFSFDGEKGIGTFTRDLDAPTRVKTTWRLLSEKGFVISHGREPSKSSFPLMSSMESPDPVRGKRCSRNPSIVSSGSVPSEWRDYGIESRKFVLL